MSGEKLVYYKELQMTYIFKCTCCSKVEKNVTEETNADNDTKILYIESYDCEECRSNVQSSIYECEHV